MHNIKILFYPVFILIVSLLPVYLFRKSRKEVVILAGVIIYFFVLNREFLRGQLAAWHDTGQHEYFLLVFKQWLDTGTSVGWNPYMNGGAPLYLFSNNFLWAAWAPFCWLNKFINLDAHTLFNLFWMFQFVNFCIGGFLLFSLLYDNFKAALFSFIALMFSGMFIVNLGQPTGLNIIYYFPYLLFSLILFYKKKNIYALGLAIIFLGIALNHYMPLYIILTLGIVIFFLLVFNFKSLPSRLSLLKSKYGIVLLALVISLLAASPVLLLYGEMQDYISPIRGSLGPGGALKPGQTGSQPNVNAPLWAYKLLWEQITPYRGNIHHAFYFGIIPLLLILISLFRWRDRYLRVILASAILILFLGTGNDFWGYRMLIRYAPGFNMLRHSFGLAHFFNFLLICLAGYGLKGLLERFSSKDKKIPAKYIYPFLIFLLFTDLTLFYTRHYKVNLSGEKPHALARIVYPLKRTFFTLEPSLLAPDLSPIIFKRASLRHPNNEYTIFRSPRFDDMLKVSDFRIGYERALGVNGAIIYFTQNCKIAPEAMPKEELIKDIFEDSFKNPLPENRSVFFSERDVDFKEKSSKRVSAKALIKYNKIDNPNELGIVVDAPADGFLIRTENFHSKWQAFIDGKKTPLYRANYAFQAIRIEEGRHKVSFRFSSIYPLLLYIHIFCVFLNWVLFNACLFKNSGKADIT